MKRIYRLLVLLMGLVIFMGAYLLVKQDDFSHYNGPNPVQSQQN